VVIKETESAREDSRKTRKALTESVIDHDYPALGTYGLGYSLFLDNKWRKHPFIHPDEVKYGL